MAVRKKGFSIPSQYKIIIFFFIPLFLLPVYMVFMDAFGVAIARVLFVVFISWLGYRIFGHRKVLLQFRKKQKKLYLKL